MLNSNKISAQKEVVQLRIRSWIRTGVVHDLIRLTASPNSNRRPISILIWGMEGGAFANLSTALARGLLDAGSGPVDLLYLRNGPGDTVSVPDQARLVSLRVRRAATLPIALIRYLRRERPRVLLTMPTIVTLPALLAYRFAGKRVREETRFVIYQGDTLRSDVIIEHPNSPRLRMIPFLAQLLYPLADALTTCAPGVLALLQQDGIPIPRGRVEVIANPVNVQDYHRRSASSPVHPWIVTKTGPVITTLGRLAKRKNHVMLFRALATIRKKGIDARLVVIGEGPELEASRAAAAELGVADSVSFPGRMSNPHADIARSDVFVMSSVDEAFCLALVEAMACGVPVLSTDAIGGGPRFILTGSGGAPAPAAGDCEVLRAALIPRGDDVAMAAALHRVLTDGGFRARLADAVRRRANDFGPEPIGRKWIAFIESLG